MIKATVWVPYLVPTVQKVTETRNCSLSREYVMQFKSTAVLHYVEGVSELLRRCIQQQGIGADFRSDTTLRSHAAKSTSVKRVDLCKRGWKNTREMRFLHIKGCAKRVYICKTKISVLDSTLSIAPPREWSSTKKTLTLRLHGVCKSDFLQKILIKLAFFEREIYLSTKRCFWLTLALC